MTTQLEQAWELAKQRFAAVGIDVEEALRQLDRLPVSMHCWQGDDVSGFENPEGSLTGGIQATGNYPGKARNASELRADLEQAMRLIPGPKRLNLLSHRRSHAAVFLLGSAEFHLSALPYQPECRHRSLPHQCKRYRIHPVWRAQLHPRSGCQR